jgi:TP901 family phage tail tape measure protein
VNSDLNITVRVAVQQAQAALQQVQGQLNSMAKAGGASSGINGLNRAFGEGGKNARLFGGSLQWAGYQLSAAFTYPLVAAGRGLVQFALQNQAAFSDVRKVYGSFGDSVAVNNRELDALQKNFEALSNEFGVNQKDVDEIGAAWAQAGVRGMALSESVDTTLKAMVIGQLDANKATKSLIAIQAQYGVSSKGLVAILNDLNVVENQTGADMGGLIDGFERAAGSAADAGVDYQHLAAMIAALTPAAGSAAQAGNALKTMISRILSPTKDATDILGKLGFNVADMSWKSASATQRLEALSKQFHGLSGSQKAVVSATLASRFQINKFDVLMRDVYNGVYGAANSLSYYRTALQSTDKPTQNAAIALNELNTVLQHNPEHQLQQIGVVLKNDFGDIVVQLIPTILYFASIIGKFGSWFGGLNPSIQIVTVSFLAFLAILGPLLSYISSFQKVLNVFRLGFLDLGSAVLWAGGIVGKAFLSPFRLVSAVLTGLIGLFTGTAAATEAEAVTMETAISGLSTTFTGVGAEMSGTLLLIQSAVERTAVIMEAIWTVAMRNMVSITAGSMEGMAAATETGMAAQTLAMSTGVIAQTAVVERGFFARILSLFGGFAGRLAGFGGSIVAAIVSPWGLAIAAVVGAVIIFHKQIAEAWDNVIRYFQDGGNGLVQAFSPVVSFFDSAVGWILKAFYALPEGVQNAMLAVVHIVASAAMAVYNLFSYINPFAHHSPSLVENVTRGMAEVQKQFGTITNISAPLKKAYGDLQRFGSAVAGLGNVGKAAQRAGDIKSISDAGGGAGAVSAYKQLAADQDVLQGKANQLNAVIKQQQTVVDADQNAVDLLNNKLDTQNKILDRLRVTQQHYADLVDATKQNIQDFANTGIVGMRKFSDEIFNNDQAQKRLQLQMMKMEDAMGPIGDVQDKLSNLRGEIDQLRGQEASLRAAGAGSEITGTIDKRIKALEGQVESTQKSTSAYDDLANQLDKLQHKGQELDLENSLKFDPLTRQVDQLANGMKELPFDDILAGIKKNQNQLIGYTKSYDNATKAVNDQQAAVDQATASRDAASDRLDAEQKKLDSLKNAYSQLNDGIQQVSDALNGMTDAASKAASAAAKAAKAAAGPKQGQAAKNFDAAAGGNFPDVSGNSSLNAGNIPGDNTDLINKSTQEHLKRAQELLGKMNPFAPVMAKWNQFTGWWASNVAPGLAGLAHQIALPFENGGAAKAWDAFMNTSFMKTISNIASVAAKAAVALYKLIAPEIVTFIKNLVAYFQELIKEVGPRLLPALVALGRLFQLIWNVTKPLVEVLGVALLAAVKILYSTINGTLGPALIHIARIFGDVIGIMTDLINIFVDLVEGDWSDLWKHLVALIKDFAKLVVDLFSGIWDTIIGAIKGFVKGVVHFFQWLYDVLVGHSIIPDMIHAIVRWFLSLPGSVMGAISGLATRIVNWAKDLWKKGLSALQTGWANVKGWAIGIPNSFITTVSGLARKMQTWASDAWLKALQAMRTAWTGIKNWAVGIPAAFSGYIGSLGTYLAVRASSAFSSFHIAAQNAWAAIRGWAEGIPQSFANAIVGLTSRAFDIGKSVMQSLWNGLKAIPGIASDVASSVGHAILRMIDDIIPHEITIPGIHFKVLGKNIGAGPWHVTAIPHFAAEGGIFDKATNLVVGEAGKEVVLPLTRPARAMQLAKDSGLLDLIMRNAATANAGVQSAMSVGAAAARVGSVTGAGAAGASIKYEYNQTNNYYVTVKMDAPSSKAGTTDAETWITNLENLARSKA